MDILATINDIIGALTLIVTGLLTFAMIVPGDQPEKTLQKILDFLKRFSKK